VFTFWRLTRSNELVVARAIGVSVWQFLSPILVAAILIGVLKVGMINPIGAALVAEFDRLEMRYLRGHGNALDVSHAGIWLRQASETALTRSGLVTRFPEIEARDELGDVARGFSTLLSRLNEYTGYLRTLAGKLAHEIRTPLTIVRSSLDNLEAEAVPEGARTYLARARQGSERLNAILISMGAATRVEEAISSAERVSFDLVPLLVSALGAYRSAFPGRTFLSELPREPVVLSGAPDLIVQMLDKLIDNAVDFSPEGSAITVRLLVPPQAAVIEVDNRGPALPAHTQGRLFESLWQSRPGGDSRPHFGLGLYIVRLIAEFHGGEASADNLPDGAGVRISVRLAR